jgi:hypothetical protein
MSRNREDAKTNEDHEDPCCTKTCVFAIFVFFVNFVVPALSYGRGGLR